MEKILFAQPLYPSVEAFKAIGINIEETDNLEFLSVTLPENWSIKKESNWLGDTVEVFDEKGRLRAYSLHVASSCQHVLSSGTRLYQRYNITYKAEGNLGQQTFEVFFVDNADNKVIFSAGKTKNEPGYNEKGKINSGNRLVEICEEFAKKHFPDWENCLSYWDE